MDWIEWNEYNINISLCGYYISNRPVWSTAMAAIHSQAMNENEIKRRKKGEEKKRFSSITDDDCSHTYNWYTQTIRECAKSNYLFIIMDQR